MYSPQKYSENLKPYVDIANRLFQKHRKLLKWNSEPESILEIGIGDGKITNEIILPIVPKNIKEYVGLDISDVMLESAKKTIGHKKFKIFQIDGATRKLPVELKSRFHHIFSNYCLHCFHKQDIRQVLKNIYDMLKPGGQLFFNGFEKIFTDDAYDALQRGKWSKYSNKIFISPFYYSENPIEDYKNVIKSVGFVDCQIYSEYFPNPNLPEKNFEEFAAALIRGLQYVEDGDKEEYLNDFVKAIKEAKMINVIVDKQNGERIYETPLDILTVVASKPRENI